MTFFISAWQLVLRRSLANWRLLSSVFIGIFIAIALLSGSAFYSNAVNDLGLQHALQKEYIELLDLHISAQEYTISYETFNDAQDIIEQQISRNIISFIRQEERWIKTQSYDVGWANRPVSSGSYSPTGYFHIFTNLEEHITLVDGEYAQPAPYGLSQESIEDPEFAIEGMIGSETAALCDVGVGDWMVFITESDGEEKRITIELTAIIDPLDASEEYWGMKTGIFYTPSDEGIVVPIFIPEQTLFEVVARASVEPKALYNWYYFIDLDKIDAQNAGLLKNAVQRMDRQLSANLPRSGFFTITDSVITEYQRKLMYTQIPLFFIISQIVAIILYYLVTVANMLIERQSGEIALLRSRGASTLQIVGVYFMEGLIMCLAGVVVGVPLGAFICSLLGRTDAFFLLTSGGLLPIRFTGMVFLLAAAATILCLLALLMPVVQATRRGVVHQRQTAARPLRAPFWQRYYLDLALLVLGAILYWELRERGALLNIGFFGGLEIDPLLLATPILLLLGVAIVFLRLFPITISLATRLSRYIRNTPIVIGLWYMARRPSHYSRLILLLIVATSVGMFSATYLGTIERSYEERVMYAVGSDIRLEREARQGEGKGALEQLYSGIPGVEEVSIAYRGDGKVGTVFTQTSFTLLALDPQSVARATWYRDDFSDKTLPEITNLLAEDEPIVHGITLPDGSEEIGIWVYPDAGNPELGVYARIQDGDGRYIEYKLGTTDAEYWQYLSTSLTSTATGVLPPSPLTLICIYVNAVYSQGLRSTSRGAYFDDLQVRQGFSTEPVIIEDFEDVSEWTVSPENISSPFSIQTSTGYMFTINDQIIHNGTASGQFIWSRSSAYVDNAIYPNLDTTPMTVLASRSLLDKAKLSVGDEIQIRMYAQYILISIEDVVDYFPTLDPDKEGFLIANVDRLMSIRNRLLLNPFYPNEAWLTVTPDSEQRELVLNTLDLREYGVAELYDKEAMLTELKNDPLAGAGWGGMLMIAFLGVIFVSSVGFIVYSYLSAKGRQLDFVILRTLGFSLRQIIGLVCFEQLFIIVIGMGIGTILGDRLSYIMMPFLELTEMGERVLPPFVLTIDWSTIGIAYTIITIAFIATISLLILFFSRVAIHRTLRTTGDM